MPFDNSFLREGGRLMNYLYFGTIFCLFGVVLNLAYHLWKEILKR